jgi:peptide/nickel transport system substrate-binding protein
VLLVLLAAAVLAACGAGGLFDRSTPTPKPLTATPTPAGPQTLNVCTANEPTSLYIYADQSAAANSIRQAIYDGPVDIVDYTAQPVILENLPNLDDGSAQIQTVSVQPGELVVDAFGNVTPLVAGVTLVDRDCPEGNCTYIYTGGEVNLEQVSATFMLKSGLTWSDGEPLTVDDSLFSYEINSDSEAGGDQFKFNRTAAYEVTGENTIVWTGLPGYLDPGYQSNFWFPLPRHAWGERSAAELQAAEDVNQSPLGWGPYVVEEWTSGEQISFSRNPNYWRGAEGLPHFSTLNLIFTSDLAGGLESGACDVVLPGTAASAQADALIALAESGAQVSYGPSGALEQLSLAVQPLAMDDGFNLFNDGPDFFSDVRVRQAIAYCSDRQALVDALAWGQGAVPGSYMPPQHPLASNNMQHYAYDPAAGQALLDEAGWVLGAGGIRVAQGLTTAPDGMPLSLSLHTDDSARSQAIAEILTNSLDNCGIALEVISGPAAEIFAPGPDGAVFGRDFELAQFSWPLGNQPACYLYLGQAIPGPNPDTYPYSWGGWNLTGWRSAEFDAACTLATHSLPGETSHDLQHGLAQQLFAEQLPALPLFLPKTLGAARVDFCGFVWPEGGNALQAIEDFGYAEWCD